MSVFQQKKPYSAVTVTIENLTSETYEEEDLSGIPQLVEVIKLQASGPTEAARAIRKKLKYGNVHRQIRALVILDGLIQNAGPRFQRTFADEPLLERLRVCGSSELSDADVKKKCRELFLEWSQYANTHGLEQIAKLHKELPKRKVTVTQERSKVLQETEANPFVNDEDEAEAASERRRREQEASSPSGAGGPQASLAEAGHGHGHGHAKSHSASGSGSFFGSSSKDKKKDKSKGNHKPFDLEAEKEQMKSAIAESSIATTDLMNALQSINREQERISENSVAVERFENCKLLRRKILRYIHHVESEQWLGGLLHANDELVVALMTFEQLDRSVDADSDSDDELAEQAHLYRMATMRGKEAMGKTSPPSSPPPLPAGRPDVGAHAPARPGPPPRPPASSKPSSTPPPPARNPRPAPAAVPIPAPRSAAAAADSAGANEYEEEVDNDPFGDSNIASTPAIEPGEPRWGRA